MNSRADCSGWALSDFSCTGTVSANSAQCLDVYLWFCIVMHWQLLTKEPRNPAKCNRLKTDEIYEKFRILQEEGEL